MKPLTCGIGCYLQVEHVRIEFTPVGIQKLFGVLRRDHPPHTLAVGPRMLKELPKSQAVHILYLDVGSQDKGGGFFRFVFTSHC